MNAETEAPFDGMMGQVFYSELAGHLFTAHGTDVPDRISITYFTEEKRRRLGIPNDCATESPNPSVDPRLPTLSHEEIATATEALRSRGIILLDYHFPLRGSLTAPHITSLACMRLQPPEFARFGDYGLREEKPPQRLAYVQLMLLVAYDCWNLLCTMLDQFYKTLAEIDHPNWFSGNDASYWLHALSLACSRSHQNTLRCLLKFFVPVYMDLSGSRCEPKLLRVGFCIHHNLLGAMAWEGLERPEYKGDSKFHFSPVILEQLRHCFTNTELLTTSYEPWFNPLELALRSGDGTLSELFISWMRPSDFSKLAHPHSDVFLLAAACEGRLLALAKLLVKAGAKAFKGPWNSSATYLHHLCGDDSVPPGETMEWATLLYELGDDLFARRRDGRTPLHLAAASGKVSVVRYILAKTRSRAQRHPKDESGKTPMMLAKNAEVMNEFAPWRLNSDGDAKAICDLYYASTKEWNKALHFHDGLLSVPSIHQLLYEEDGSIYLQKESDEFIRWIHVPVNNIEWCEDLLIRWLLDGDGDCDVQNFEAAQQAFNQQHVSRTPQGRFFRPGVYCTQSSRHIVFIATPYMDFETSSGIEEMQKALQVSDSTRSTA